MVARLTVWLVAAVLGQPAAEPPAWLKAVPADVDVAIRIRGLDATRQDLSALLKAMSPTLSATAEPQLTNLLNQAQAMHGEAAVKQPWVGLVRAAPAAAGGGVPFAVMVLDGDYRGVLKGIAGGKEVELKALDGGIDSFASPQGDGVWYAAKGPGFTACGPDRSLIAAIARPGGKTLDQVLTPALAGPFLSGDVGAYVNVAALASRYADVIEQTRQALMTGLDQAGEQQGNPASMKAVKPMYDQLFRSIKDVSALTLNLDFAADRLHLAGVLDAKAGTSIAGAAAAGRSGNSSGLGRFPADAAFYGYFNMDAHDFQKFQGMSLRMINPEGKTSPAYDRAMAQLRDLGRIEVLGDSGFAGGIRAVNVIEVSDPKTYIAATRAMMLAMKSGEGPFGVYKDVQITEGDKTARGFTFDRLTGTIDLDKMAQLGGQNQAGAASMKAMFGGGVMTLWIGTDGKRVIQLTVPTWDDARAQLDTFLDGNGGISSTPGFKTVRSALPEQASMLMLLNGQGMLRMITAVQNNPALKPPDDLPREPALIGLSLTPRAPTAYEFHLVLPSTIGPVFEKGLAPLMQAPAVKPPAVKPPAVKQ